MKTPHQGLAELTLDLTTLEVHLRPLVALWTRIGGAAPGARLDAVYARLKALRAALDGQEQELAGMRAAADAAMGESEDLRRELATFKALAFANRPVVIFAEGVTP